MNRKIVILICILTAFLAFKVGDAHAVEIRLHGRAGATYENGQLKVCPGFTFNVCATINITWEDIKELFKKNRSASVDDILQQLPNIVVTLYDEHGNTTERISCRIVYINKELLRQDNPDAFYGEQFRFVNSN